MVLKKNYGTNKPILRANKKESRGMQTKTVYKIVPADDWRQACNAGDYKGSRDDARDGFIHLSAPAQIAGTLEKHFFQQPDLLVVGFRSADLAPHLKWEPSRNGALFPHYYGPLPTRLAQSTARLILDATKKHIISELME